MIFTKVSCSASSGAELLSSPGFGLSDFYATEHTAVILLTPYLVIQPDKFGRSGKSVGFAVELNPILIQIQSFADCLISVPVDSHGAYSVFLFICHGTSSFLGLTSHLFGIHTG